MTGTYIQNELEKLLGVIKDAAEGGFNVTVKKSKQNWIVKVIR